MSARPSSSVVRMPPSAAATFFVALSEKHAASEPSIDPILWPR